MATVVGVVRAIRHDGLRNELRPELYVPFRQTAFPPENLVVRTNGDPRAAIQQIRATLAQLEAPSPTAQERLLASRRLLVEAERQAQECVKLQAGLRDPGAQR